MRKATVPLAVLGLLLAGAGTAQAAPADGPVPPGLVALGNPEFTANAMAPLKVTDWADFEADLDAVAAYGVDAISVDVWWGDVEGAADNQFEWDYYDRVFEVITAAGLDLAPILSFHQAGGNVGDDYTSLLPEWLWEKYAGRSSQGVHLDEYGLQHRSEQGNHSRESVQGWADRLVMNEYRDFTRAFEDRYGDRYAEDVVEVNVSLGPSGELRYPSYNQHDEGTGYPTRGALQAYSPLAIRDFQETTLARYGSLAEVNRAWGTDLTSRDQIAPPEDAEAFFTSRAYLETQYGRDFVDWYNGSLVDHGERVLRTVIRTLGDEFPGADIGYKVPGIHWSMTHPVHPRATEVTTGLIQTSVDVDSWATGHGYQRIVELANRFDGGPREVVVHFTALEMDDQDYAPQYSLAQTLVQWIGDYAHRAGVETKGENALAGGLYSEEGWDNIEEAFAGWGYLGLTVLRVGDVSEGVGARRYAELIATYGPQR
ncbi:Glycosyl hydrolase family 14 [Geodermatophilus dictyosporus]|uniref:Beta-amylase n=1 Tax=Geodermatophilus dictyosporus TaxID=1523247 RepID=A0A1I5PDH6_9ACTN|nr:family 14 glycosylhydrolase [Geodermatophilus dictyosporus]SFP31880.1 Glycosyl hydrolase family 14 [Geodermatophilus dictyosporus]